MKLNKRLSKSIAYNFVQFILDNNMCTNIGKFKPGDKVEYNWFAKVQILTAIGQNLGKVLTIKSFDIPNCNDHVDFIEGGSCHIFWLKKK